MSSKPGVDPEKLKGVLSTIDTTVDELLFATSRINKTFRGLELFSLLRQHINVHGNNWAFDTPAYHYWLHQSAAIRQRDLQQWSKVLAPIQRGGELV